MRAASSYCATARVGKLSWPSTLTLGAGLLRIRLKEHCLQGGCALCMHLLARSLGWSVCQWP